MLFRSQVSGTSIPNPISGEFGVVGYYSAVHDTIWFGTSSGRVYRSTDKGLTYTVSSVPALAGKYVKPTFRNGQHGLVQDKGAGSTGTISETFDGGVTWAPVNTSGTIYATDLAYIPGTENTWVSSGSTGNMGSSYSFDGGHTWTDFAGTQGAKYMQMTWINNHCGWAGGVNVSATENGVYKFIGMLNAPVPAPTNLQAVVASHNVNLTWNAPAANPTGYNMYRNGLKLNITPITGLMYDDLNVTSGSYTYCVKALYLSGESDGSCANVDVAVGIGENSLQALRVYPNPATSRLNVFSEIEGHFVILNSSGFEVMSGTMTKNKTVVDISKLPVGIYVLRVPSSGVCTKFIKIQ